MKLTPLLCLGTAALLLSGCKSRVVFATHSSIGLDASGTAEFPNRVSFSFYRYEAAIVPRKTDGQAHSVYGGLDADVTWFSGHTIKQTFATGEAAKLATSEGLRGSAAVASSVNKEAPLIFFTGTTYGLLLSAGEKEMSPNLLLGYRRSEVAVIPVPDPSEEVRSVYADILINSSTNGRPTITTNFSVLGGTRIRQSFATGRAAENLARVPEVKKRLDHAANLASMKTYSTGFDIQEQLVLRTIEHFSNGDDGKKTAILLKAKLLKLVDQDTKPDLFTRRLRRSMDAADKDRTLALEQLEAFAAAQ